MTIIGRFSWLLLPVLVSMPVASAQTIQTVAGTGAAGYNGDNQAANRAALQHPRSVARDSGGNLYIADMYNHRIRKVDGEGRITTVAGTGAVGFSGDGLLATQAQLNWPRSVAVDTAGNLYIADMYNNRVRKVDSGGRITTIAGTGGTGSGGDNGLATRAQLNLPGSVVVDKQGILYVAEHDGNRIRKIDASGTITTVAGTGTAGFSGDFGPAVNASIQQPNAVWVDDQGVMYIADTLNNRIRKVATDGVITTVAGTGAAAFGGDGGLATRAQLRTPRAVILDDQGTMYIADSDNHRIRKVATDGVITTVAGTGGMGFGGDGGPAAAATLNQPRGMVLGPNSRLYFGDADNHRVRVIDLPPPVVQTRPEISAVVNGASFLPGIASSTWITITGRNLASSTRSWAQADFSSGRLPMALDGVQVRINGRSSPVYYISPTQINALANDDETEGQVPVEVVTASGASVPFQTRRSRVSPAFFLFSGSQLAIGVASDGTLLGAPEDLPGVAVRRARPGEVVMLFGTGFGPTEPVSPAELLVLQPARMAMPLTIRVGGVPAKVLYSGLVGSGLYQFNVEVPATVSGKQPLIAEVNGSTSPATVVLAIE